MITIAMPYERALQARATDMPMVVTLLRLPIAALVVFTVLNGHPLLGAIALIVFTLVDVADGILARRVDLDDSLRRAVDSIIDRISVTSVFFAASTVNILFLIPACLILIANLIPVFIASETWIATRSVLKAPKSHKIWSLSLFVSGLAFYLNFTWLSAMIAVAGSVCMIHCSIRLRISHLELLEQLKRL